MSREIAPTDEALLELLRVHPLLTVNQMVDQLGVTATAVRQRLARLMAGELVRRHDQRGGRGRPSYCYELTAKGRRTGGDNLDDLARVLWNEIQQLEDGRVRTSLMSRVVNRLAHLYQGQITGRTLQERMQSIATIFGRRHIPLVVESADGHPVLKVLGCPYPALADEDEHICQMEAELFSRLSGEPVQLDCCQRDGASCCTFQPVTVSGQSG